MSLKGKQSGQSAQNISGNAPNGKSAPNGQSVPNKKRESFIPYFILTLIAGYAVFLLISTQVEIQNKKNEYDTIHNKLLEVRAANEELERYLKGDEYIYEYMEGIARGKLSYAHPRERIYYIMPSS
ncbi:MAG: septum formation initiator family protein [Oscillospiraceae bacterium]|nr:septum formation initiator family protein [Oscillospiraceae bacterium]